MSLLRLIRHYNYRDEVIVVNLMHVVTLKQHKDIISFYSVSDRVFVVDFPDEKTAKKEILDIIDTLNTFVGKKKETFKTSEI